MKVTRKVLVTVAVMVSTGFMVERVVAVEMQMEVVVVTVGNGDSVRCDEAGERVCRMGSCSSQWW
jgi:hypothetical protein